ncbi:MAG: hypothetical protein Q4D38_12565 [Planctomycetia bacterium]|nr:hypothetical protein [Planctomycetia bacterium]
MNFGGAPLGLSVKRLSHRLELRAASGLWWVVVMARETGSVSDCLPTMLQPAEAVVTPGRARRAAPFVLGSTDSPESEGCFRAVYQIIKDV